MKDIKNTVLAFIAAVFLVWACSAGAGIMDRFSKIELKPDPDNYIYMPNLSAAPGTPASGWGSVYVTGDDIYFKDSAGTASSLTGTTSTFGTITFTNGLTIDNATNNAFEWNENGEEVIWTFTPDAGIFPGKLELTSTSGVEELTLFDGTDAIITSASDAAGEDFTIRLTGSNDSSLILSSSGTGGDAFQITAASGGIDIMSGGTIAMEGAIALNSVKTFVDSDATPDVSGDSYFNTNTTAVTITDFDGSGIAAGQILYVVSKGAITYDVTSSGIKGGTTDIVTATGDVTTFLYDGTDWLVTSRIDASSNLN